MINKKQHEQFLEVYDELADALFRHCYFRVSDREVAKDLVQDTFVKTWEYILEGKNIEDMQAFLYKVASRKVIDYYRKKKSASLENMGESGFDPATNDDEVIMQEIEGNHVVSVLDKLGDGDRDVIVMRYIDELSPREIGDMLGIKENAISVRINRAIKRLTQVLHIYE